MNSTPVPCSLFPVPSHKAFSLVELLVVIGIIGILAGILLTSFSGGTDSARAAKCLSNLRSLATAASSYATHHHNFPYAGSHASVAMDTQGTYYKECRGWISWLSQNDEYGTHKSGEKHHARNFIACKNVSAYSDDDEEARFAITNGALWASVNGNLEVYTCPLHVRHATKKGAKVRWSYVMSSAFGYDSTDGSDASAISGESDGLYINSGRLDRRLMFAELPFNGTASRYDEGGKSGTYPSGASAEVDGVLQYKADYRGKSYGTSWKGSAETLAFNHKSGKRWCAHVVFADGHVEKLLKPQDSGLTDEQLTALLCAGADVSFTGKSYELMQDGDEN